MFIISCALLLRMILTCENPHCQYRILYDSQAPEYYAYNYDHAEYITPEYVYDYENSYYFDNEVVYEMPLNYTTPNENNNAPFYTPLNDELYEYLEEGISIIDTRDNIEYNTTNNQPNIQEQNTFYSYEIIADDRRQPQSQTFSAYTPQIVEVERMPIKEESIVDRKMAVAEPTFYDQPKIVDFKQPVENRTTTSFIPVMLDYENKNTMVDSSTKKQQTTSTYSSQSNTPKTNESQSYTKEESVTKSGATPKENYSESKKQSSDMKPEVISANPNLSNMNKPKTDTLSKPESMAAKELSLEDKKGMANKNEKGNNTLENQKKENDMLNKNKDKQENNLKNKKKKEEEDNGVGDVSLTGILIVMVLML